MTHPLRLVIEQTAPRRGDPYANAAGMQAALDVVAAEGPTLIAFPELALTGYGLGSRTAELALPETDPPPVRTAEGVVAIFGYPELAADQRIFNTAGAVSGARWVHRHRKCFLPTYGTFDEGRFFAASREGPTVFDVHGWAVATLVCEDLWHPSLTYLAALRGADLIVALAAAPGRSPDSDGGFVSMDRWVHMAEALASFHQVWVAVANRSGVEGGVTFAGGSFLVAPDGSLVERLGPEAGARLETDLDRRTLQQARARFSHLRDEDGSLLLRELERTLHPDASGR
jgi:predicted amidohydrolase